MTTQYICGGVDLGHNSSSETGHCLLEFLCQNQLNSQTIQKLLHQYGLLPKLLQEMLIDQEIAEIDCGPEETLVGLQRFYSNHGIGSEADFKAWVQHNGITVEQVQLQIQRTLRIEQYKQRQWSNKLESSFLTQKPQLDQIVYSLLRVQDFAMAQEIFFRIQSGEQSFVEAAKEYSQGAEAQTGGMLGPTSLSQVHPVLAARLKSSQAGQVLPPVKIGEWVVVLRLEQYLPAQLDEITQQKLLDSLFQAWLQTEVGQLMKKVLATLDGISPQEAV